MPTSASNLRMYVRFDLFANAGELLGAGELDSLLCVLLSHRFLDSKLTHSHQRINATYNVSFIPLYMADLSGLSFNADFPRRALYICISKDIRCVSVSIRHSSKAMR